jgi:CDP-6-deoxy-D-xylo-4-hexulose-3-dehydrase
MKFFIKNINKSKYYYNFDTSGMSNYAFPVILKKKSIKIRDKFEKYLSKNSIEFRRGNAGGGNQMRQPYLKNLISFNKSKFINTEYLHHFGYYIGNYPQLKLKKLKKLIYILNNF